MFNWFRRKKPAATATAPAPNKRNRGVFSTDVDTTEWETDAYRLRQQVAERTMPLTSANLHRVPPARPAVNADGSTWTMDEYESGDGLEGLKQQFVLGMQNVSELQLSWYGAQGFIGYQLCAIIAQHWLVNKACTMPAKDAVRKGYDITVNDGTQIPPATIDVMRLHDRRMKINKHMVEFVRFGKMFGIRHALFVVENPDPDYYLKPFNPDSITPGSYKGISQVDPYWITPELSFEAAGDPAARDFYEPTWWRIGKQRYHKSHFVIMRGDEVADILKPSYLYAGLSMPQMIYERVYAAERTANEAPMLAATKRLNVIHTDIEKVMAAPQAFFRKMAAWVQMRDNYGVKVAGEDEKIEQFDTALSDLDAVIMTQYQIVAAVANVPSTKLLGTTPKGFQSTGEFEESSYHEELETIQAHELTPLLERHYTCLIRSAISPGAPFGVTITWKPVDSPTAVELSEINKNNAMAGLALAQSGAIDGQDERTRLIADPNSGYSGMQALVPADVVQPTELTPKDK